MGKFVFTLSRFIDISDMAKKTESVISKTQ